MNWLHDYTERFRLAGKTELAQTVEKTAGEFCGHFLNDFDYFSNTAALLFSNVQSGKTAQMFGIISAAADLDFNFFLVLTTDNVILQQQTLERVKKDLPDFCVCGEEDSVLLETTDGTKPTVIVLKKNARTLRHWEKTLRTTRVLSGNPLFILDDEADASSLNTKVNSDDISTINDLLAKIRSNACGTIFLQVTGTPQSIFLQTEESEWQPVYTQYFEPGKSYLGGNFFFPESAFAPLCISFIDDNANALKDFVVRHLTVSAIKMNGKDSVSNAVVHNSSLTSQHEKLAGDVQIILNEFQETPNEFYPLFFKQIELIQARSTDEIDAETILSFVKKNVIPYARVYQINTKSAFERDSLQNGCNFIVGGNSLGRGVTFPALNTFFYTRSAKKPQADTVWQHNRIFGYDRDPYLVQVFMTRKLYKLLADINAANNAVISQVKAGIQKVKLCYPKDVKPTRANVIDKKALELIPGGKNFFPADPANKSIRKLDELLAPYGDEGSSTVSVAFMKEVLSQIESKGDDFSIKAYLSIFDAMLSADSSQMGRLIVRRNRDVTKGTGALLSSSDWELSGHYTDVPVMTMYKVTGSKGWGGQELWVPNIRLPDESVYYGLN